VQSMAETKFRTLREETLRVSRETVARRTRSLSLGTIKNAEAGAAVRRTTAHELLAAVNSLLREANLPEVGLEDLGLTLRQDRREPIERVA
jgi:hypothetical protein